MLNGVNDILFALNASSKQVHLTVGAVMRTVIIHGQRLLQPCHAVVVQYVGKHQHGGVGVVGNTLAIIEGKKVKLPGVTTHSFTRLVTGMACLINKMYGLCQLAFKTEILAQHQVVADFGKRTDDALAHILVGGNLTHGIGVALKGFTYKHVLKHLLTLLADTAAVKHFGILRLTDGAGIA